MEANSNPISDDSSQEKEKGIMSEEQNSSNIEQVLVISTRIYRENFIQMMEEAVNSPESLARIHEAAPLVAEALAGAMCDAIESKRNERMEEIKRKSAKLQLIVFSSIIIVQTACAVWFYFIQRDIALAWQFVGFALVFAIVLIVGSLIDGFQ